jgi:hypothetical protein
MTMGRSSHLLPHQYQLAPIPAETCLNTPNHISQPTTRDYFRLETALMATTNGRVTDVLFRQVAQNESSDSLPPGHMSLPRFNAQFAVNDISLQEAEPDAHFPTQRGFAQTTGTRTDPLLSPISLLDADVRMNAEPLKQNQSKDTFRSRRPSRKSASRAEQMISDVENLYEFGIRLSIFPEDPMLRKSLKRMKERFRNLVQPESLCDQRDMYEDSTSETDVDE